MVIGMRDPEVAWGLVSVKKRERWPGTGDNIVCNHVVCLCRIFDEYRVTSGIPVHVAVDKQVLDTMDCSTAIVTSHDNVVLDVRLADMTNHVEVNWVLSKQECLTNIFKLQILDSSDDRLISWRVQHNMSTELICG